MNSRGARPVCVLVGPPGAGKTTVGRLVAATLGVEFRDTDTDVESAAGKPVPDIFIEDGEDAFRRLESAAVAAALSTFGGVLALGGGAVLAERTRDALRAHRVVYLSVGPSAAYERVGMVGGRPLLRVNPRATLRHLLAQRAPLYEQVATLTVVTDGRSVDDIAGEVLAAIAR